MQQQGNRLPTRAEIDDRFKWNLNELYPTEQAWEQAMERGQAADRAGRLVQDWLSESSEVLLEALQVSDELGQRLGRIVAYARLHRDTDTTNPKYQANEGRAMSLSPKPRRPRRTWCRKS